MADYSNDILSAYDDIKDAGLSITINRKVDGTFEPKLGVKVYQTALLNADIDNSVTTLTLKSESGVFYDSGSIWINQEKISYTGVSGSDLTGLTRGVNPTTAASHSEDDEVFLIAQEANYSTYAVITRFNSYERNGIDALSTVKMGDKKLLIPSYGLSIVPTVRDTITMSGKDWMIVNLDQIEPNDEPILYICHIRGIE